jgi:hypothetical protein
LYTQHHEGQHPSRWTEYQGLSDEAKANFFTSVTPVVNTLHSHFAGAGDQLFFDIDVPIVDVIIRQLLFDPAVEDVTLERALSVFVPMRPSDEQALTHYRVHVKNVKLFRLVIGQVGLGCSFCMASRQIATVREELSLGFLSGCNDKMVSQFVRIAAGACLQKIREILSNTWAFSVAFDSATVDATSYFDVRVRVAIETTIHCFHCFCLPLYGSHTGELMFDVFRQAMDALCPGWVHTLLSTCADGARNMQGRLRGIVSRIARCSTAAGHTLIRFWCGAHQLDLVVAKAVSAYCDESWYGTLTALIGYLRRQQNLVHEMRTKCPKVASTRWLSLGKVLPWFARHRVRILQYLEEKSPSCTPSVSWWISLPALRRVLDEVNILFKSLQFSSLLLTQQQASFCNFIVSLREKFSVRGPLSATEMAAWDDTQGCREGEFAVLSSDVLLFIRGLGSAEAALFGALPQSERNTVVSYFAAFVVRCADGVHKIDPERDEASNAAGVSLPPILPKDFAILMPSSFIDVVIRFRSRLLRKFGDGYIVALEEEHCSLRDLYVRNQEFHTMLDNMPADIDFHDAWVTVQPQFPKLCVFAGGLATIYPGTTRVEGDFSVIGWEKNIYRSALMDFALEGIMHTKEFKSLQAC